MVAVLLLDTNRTPETVKSDALLLAVYVSADNRRRRAITNRRLIDIAAPGGICGVRRHGLRHHSAKSVVLEDNGPFILVALG